MLMEAHSQIPTSAEKGVALQSGRSCILIGFCINAIAPPRPTSTALQAYPLISLIQRSLTGRCKRISNTQAVHTTENMTHLQLTTPIWRICLEPADTM